MTATALHSGFTQEALRRLPAIAARARLADRAPPRAWETFQELPLPERRQEEWMRTDIRGFRLENFGFARADCQAIVPCRRRC